MANARLHVHALQCPSTFLTFSPADPHWESLAKHMPRYEEWKAAAEPVRMRISRENLRDNPHISTYHFFKRFNLREQYGCLAGGATGAEDGRSLAPTSLFPKPTCSSSSKETKGARADTRGRISVAMSLYDCDFCSALEQYWAM